MYTPIISVEKLSKAFRIGAKEEVPDTITQAALGLLKSPLKNLRNLKNLDTSSIQNSANHNDFESDSDVLWALRDVSFEVNQGDVVGVIGRNGAGKSTLLKVLSRITEPTSGRAVIRGRVSSLLEVGTGFHPELTGRENIYMNGTILGMTKKEIDSKFDEIVDFSGIERFLDTPTKRYSSGMQVRLAFAVAAHLDPEVLVVDEVLAVGDMEFQRKCINKMQSISSTGRTVLFVSHNMAAIESLCTRVVGLANHTVAIDSSVSEGMQWYLNLPQASQKPSERTDRQGNGIVKINDISIGPANNDRSVIHMGDAIAIRVNIATREEVSVHVGIAVLDDFGTRIMRLNTTDMSVAPLPLKGEGIVTCKTSSLNFLPGNYALSIGVSDANGEQLDLLHNAADFDVHPAKVFPSGVIPSESGAKLFCLSQWQSD